MTEIRAPYAGRTLPVGTTAERDLRDEISQLRVQLAELDAFNNDLLADVARLRAGIEGFRLEHATHTVWADDGDGYRDEMQEPCPAERGLVPGPCECGAAEHNAKVDALLAGKP